MGQRNTAWSRKLTTRCYFIEVIWLCGKRICLKCRSKGSIQPFKGREGPLEQEIATQSSILAWEIPWTKEPGGLQAHGVAKGLDIS